MYCFSFARDIINLDDQREIRHNSIVYVLDMRMVRFTAECLWCFASFACENNHKNWIWDSVAIPFSVYGNAIKSRKLYCEFPVSYSE